MGTETGGRDAGTQHGAGRPALALLALLALFILAAVAVALLAESTRERRARNEAAQVMKVLRTLLPAGIYDNEPDRDRILVREPDLLGSDEPLPVYRARLRDEPVAAVITAVARQGYVGPIRLLVAVGADARIIGVRVVAHQETPGLGGRIDSPRIGWLRSLAGRSLLDPPAGRWSVRRDGGEFDQLSGATITSRAVVQAVRDALLFYERERASVFLRPAE